MYFSFIKDFFTAFTVINAYRFDCYSLCSGFDFSWSHAAMLVFAKRVG